MSDTKTVTVGPGFLGLLTLVFVTLQLCGVIAWSWWWVLAPLWIPFAIFAVAAGLFFIGYLAFAKHGR